MKPLMTFLLENLDSPQETKVLLDKNGAHEVIKVFLILYFFSNKIFFFCLKSGKYFSFGEIWPDFLKSDFDGTYNSAGNAQYCFNL